MESVAYRDLVFGERAGEARRTREARGDGRNDYANRKLFSIPYQKLHWGAGGGRTHGDRILDLDIRPLVSSEATPVCDVLQYCAIWILLLAINN